MRDIGNRRIEKDTDDVVTGLLKMRNFGIKKHKEH